MPKPETALVRLLVCDTRTGMIGSVDLPYPAQILSASLPRSDRGDGEAAKIADQPSPQAQTSPHVIKFHGNGGRNAILEWNAEKITYSRDMQPEASAKALFDSLWAKSYTCENGRLLSAGDKTTPAPQPLHFRADDSHSAEVYLDAQGEVRYAGNVAVDASVKPFFEALRTLYHLESSGDVHSEVM